MTERTERWLPVVGYEGYYEVSDCGRVRSLDRVIEDRRGRRRWLVGRVLRTCRGNQNGHVMVSLYTEGERGPRWIHRLVLEAFIGPCPEGTECCHNDGNPANNALSNLRWDTPKSNAADSLRHGTHSSLGFRGADHPRSKLSEQDVLEIRVAVASGKRQRDIAIQCGVHQKTISKIARRRSWQHLEMN